MKEFKQFTYCDLCRAEFIECDHEKHINAVHSSEICLDGRTIQIKDICLKCSDALFKTVTSLILWKTDE